MSAVAAEAEQEAACCLAAGEHLNAQGNAAHTICNSSHSLLQSCSKRRPVIAQHVQAAILLGLQPMPCGAACLASSPRLLLLQKRSKKRPAIWQHVQGNIITHRAPKVEKEDDIMICNCKRPSDGRPGCGEDCLNRSLAQECHPVSGQDA